MRTRLTELLGVEHPVMLAGMGGVSYSALVAAVSIAGGYGCLGASTMSSAQLAQEISATRLLTAKPFGVDLLDGVSRHAQRKRGAPHRGRGQHVRRGTRRASARDRTLSPPWGARHLDVRQG